MPQDADVSLSDAMKKKEESLPRAFKKLMKEHGIKDKSIEILTQNDIDSISALITLSHKDITE